jgi:hypothetical protein
MPQPKSDTSLSRRKFLALSGTGAAALASGALLNSELAPSVHATEIPPSRPREPQEYPIGIELYAVRGELSRNLPNTLRTVAQIGYKVVEFYSPYLSWTFPRAKEVRTLLDDLGLRCFSTHNAFGALTPGETMAKAIELNQILGARHIILASPPPNTNGLEDWKRVSGQLTAAVDQLKPHGLFAGFGRHCRQYPARIHPSTRCRHVPGGGRGPGRVDQGESRPH